LVWAEVNAVYEKEPETLVTLKARLADDAPWVGISLPYPIVESRRYSAKGDCPPKVFYYPERAYLNRIEMDGVKHLFHWRNELYCDGSPESPYSYTQTWQCNCAGMPGIKSKKENVKHHNNFKTFKARGCQARIYVHIFKKGHPSDPAIQIPMRYIASDWYTTVATPAMSWAIRKFFSICPLVAPSVTPSWPSSNKV